MEFTDVLAGIEDFITAFAGFTGLSITYTTLLVGLVGGGLFVGLIGRITNKMGAWRNNMRAINQPQTATTSTTPAQVMRSGRMGCLSLALAYSIIGLVLLIMGIWIVGGSRTLSMIVRIVVESLVAQWR